MKPVGYNHSKPWRIRLRCSLSTTGLPQIGYNRPQVAGGPGVTTGPPLAEANAKAVDIAIRINLEMAPEFDWNGEEA
jgi:hypothetical protein